MDYKKAYFTLFNKITKAIELLQKAQIETEKEYIETEENLMILQKLKENKD